MNRVLADVGLDAMAARLARRSPDSALATILVVMIWQFSGLAMVLFLAGLQGISDDVYEATLIDGASAGFGCARSSCRCLRPR